MQHLAVSNQNSGMGIRRWEASCRCRGVMIPYNDIHSIFQSSQASCSAQNNY